MKTITMFIIETCPYCQEALRWMNALIAENKEYEDLTINIIDEHAHPEIADKYDYYLVPTYYVGDEKVHEGAASLKKIKKVLDTAATLLK